MKDKENLGVLKGNFETKKKVHSVKSNENAHAPISEKMKEQALASLGGSMVYMERKKRTWDGK